MKVESVSVRDLDPFPSGMRSLVRDLTTDSQLRWLGPEKGILQMATGALVNAARDLQARRAALMREEISPGRRLPLDANQCRDVPEAIRQVNLHEHFLDPCVVRSARYLAPEAPGTSIAMTPESLETYELPGDAAWRN